MKNHGNGTLFTVYQSSITCDEYGYIDANELTSIGPATTKQSVLTVFINQLPFLDHDECVEIIEHFHKLLTHRSTCVCAHHGPNFAIASLSKLLVENKYEN